MISSLIGIIASSGGVAGGDYESIATVTVGAGGAASATFSSIPSTYTHLQIRVLSRGVNTGPLYTKMVFNSDTGANYSYHQLYGDGTSAAAGAGTSTSFAIAADGVYSTPGFNGSVIDILDYANTNKNKTTRTLSGQDNNGSGYVHLTSSLWRSTTAINSIVLSLSSGNYAEYSSFALYGIKG